MAMIELHRTEVDQVITIWADAPLPLRAGLLFRTGRADETLVTSGQTHLIEHLALSTMDDPGLRHNGILGAVFTEFLTIGQPQEVSSFLSDICEVLAHLPGDRLEVEKQILVAENAARAYDISANLLKWRYGAAGYGLLGLHELGLRSAAIDQLRDICEKCFTKENAVLWLTGPPPVGLRLNLPHGKKCPLPPLMPIQPALPCWFVDDMCGGVAAGAVVPRVFAASIFLEIAARRLRERLRTSQALSYAPIVYYEPINADIAHMVLYTDSDQEHREELAGAFGQVFEELGEIESSEIETSRKQILEYWTGSLAPPPADQMVAEARRAAMDWIHGKKFESMDANASGLMSVTTSDISQFWHDAKDTAIFALPSEVPIQPWMGKVTPTSTAAPVQGHKALGVDAPIQDNWLVYGSDGVSLVWPDGRHHTVRYSELAAALCYEDGAVHLIGSDAALLKVEPTLWRNGKSICSSILKQAPAYLQLSQGLRSIQDIPGPRTTMWQRILAEYLKLSPTIISIVIVGVGLIFYIGHPSLTWAIVGLAFIFLLSLWILIVRNEGEPLWIEAWKWFRGLLPYR
jgi:hypothetical protein